MSILKTPSAQFANLPGFPYQPNYLEIPDQEYGSLAMHYVDEGPKQAPVVLMLHGEPSWSFAWRDVIDAVTAAGFRAIAPDHIGFGRSDKLAQRNHYSYARFIDWMDYFVTALELENITLACQDWGGPIGLSTLARHPERFNAVVAANTLLPNNEEPPLGVADWPGDIVANWINTVAELDDLPVADIVGGVCSTPLSNEVKAAYDAPFPTPEYKAAVLAFPALIPIDHKLSGSAENRLVWELLEQWTKPFVTAFSDGDPSTAAWAKVFQSRIPGASNDLHRTIRNAGHFVQEEQGAALAEVIIAATQKGNAP
ncbi:MAG: haloalkane dehalogenase [Pseudomonadales bacterium]